MRFDKFTIKSREALAEAQDRAERSNHPDVKPLHLLAALLEGYTSPTTAPDPE